MSLLPDFQTRFLETLRARANLWRYIARLRNVPRFWPTLTVTRRIGGVSFEVDFEPDPTGIVMYLGLYEPATVQALSRFLAAGDTFLDVGANIGYLSAVGAALVGPTGQVHSFEPVPRYFQRLKRLAAMNPTYTIIPNQVAAGGGQGTAVIHTSITNIGGNSIIPGYGAVEEIADTVQTPVIRLDAYIREARLTGIALIKIDAEGFEFPVLKGLQEFFEGTDAPPTLIVEIHPTAYPLLGCTLLDLSQYMRTYRYRAYRLNAIGRAEVDLTALKRVTNLVFVAAPDS